MCADFLGVQSLVYNILYEKKDKAPHQGAYWDYKYKTLEHLVCQEQSTSSGELLEI